MCLCVLSFLICQSRATPPGVCRRSLQSALETRADSFVPEPDHFCGRPPLRRRSPGVVSRLRKPTTTLRTTASTTRFVQTSYRQQQEKKDFEYMPAVPASLLPRVKKSGVRRGGRENGAMETALSDARNALPHRCPRHLWGQAKPPVLGLWGSRSHLDDAAKKR